MEKIDYLRCNILKSLKQGGLSYKKAELKADFIISDMTTALAASELSDIFKWFNKIQKESRQKT